MYDLQVWGFNPGLKKYCHIRNECTNVPYAICKHTKIIIQDDLPTKHYCKIAKNK